jgi:hypothetical protein
MLQIPQIDDAYIALPLESFSDYYWCEFCKFDEEFYEIVGGPEWRNNPYVFTSNMSFELM